MHALLASPTPQMIAEMTSHDDTPRNGWVARSRREDVLIEMLAHEIARYTPRLARTLAQAGRARMIARLR